MPLPVVPFLLFQSDPYTCSIKPAKNRLPDTGQIIALAVRAGYSVFMVRTVLETTGYQPDDKVGDKTGAYAEHTLVELEDLLVNIIKKEDYESAARVRDASKRRGKAY